MMSKLYIDVFDYFDPKFPFTFFLGGRATGKTFSALQGIAEKKEGLILLRRTDTEMQMATVLNPFANLNSKLGWNICTGKISKDVAGFYHGEADAEGILTPQGSPIGYLLALSVLYKVRGLGVDTNSVQWMVFDEFIPEPHVREIKSEAFAFFNAYETINRNRELEGLPPIYVFFLSNTNTLNNPIFRALNLVRPIEYMLAQNKTKSLYDPDRGIAVHFLDPNPEFLARKKSTAISKLTAGTDYEGMALKNKFALEDFSGIDGRKNISGFTPFFAVGNAKIWRKKGQKIEFYVCYKDSNFSFRYGQKNSADQMLANARHGLIVRKAYAEGWIKFETLELKNILLDFFRIK